MSQKIQSTPLTFTSFMGSLDKASVVAIKPTGDNILLKGLINKDEPRLSYSRYFELIIAIGDAVLAFEVQVSTDTYSIDKFNFSYAQSDMVTKLESGCYFSVETPTLHEDNLRFGIISKNGEIKTNYPNLPNFSDGKRYFDNDGIYEETQELICTTLYIELCRQKSAFYNTVKKTIIQFLS